MLDEYKRKRDFKLTPEPAAHVAANAGELKFVIQKHAARRLHYDFRLEIDGVLVSWAVPKGPSLNPAEKRLAVQTEDHPLDYAQFEGVIPAGEYGGGPVIIWDEGTYSPDGGGNTSWGDRDEAQKRMREGIKKGKISIFLKGHKLQGSWTLFRLANKDKDWILMKHKDDFMQRDEDITEQDRSVTSGRTIVELKEGKAPSNPLVNLTSLPGAKTARFPSELTPMSASLADGPFQEPGWVFEPKMDGIRAVAFIRNGQVRLVSRNGLDLTRSYPTVVNELSAYNRDLVLDGEIVALDESGRPSFQLLQQRSGLSRATDVKVAEASNPAFFYVFDIVHLDNKNLDAVPLHQRKALLKQTLVAAEHIRAIDGLEIDGFTAFQACVASGMEGLVAKRVDSRYEPGRRSKSWLKIKTTLTSEFVVCGYTQGTGSRNSTFGSIILGYYDKGRLVYAGGCGTGFNERILREMIQQFQQLETGASPFAKKVPGKQIHWLKPQLVAEVKFAEWTNDGILRAPVFMRLREDKAPEDCTRDQIHTEKKMQEPHEPMVDKPKILNSTANANANGKANDKPNTHSHAQNSSSNDKPNAHSPDKENAKAKTKVKVKANDKGKDQAKAQAQAQAKAKAKAKAKDQAKDQARAKSKATANDKEKDNAQSLPRNRRVIELAEKREEKRAENQAQKQAQKQAHNALWNTKAGIDLELLDRITNAKEKITIEVEEHSIALSNLDKVFWPQHGSEKALTKRDYLIYLLRVAPWLLPHTTDRPITLVRFPNGISGPKFYQKHWENNLPEFVETVWIYGEHAAGDQRYMVCNNLPTLLWLGQIADLEIHTWQSRINPEPEAHNLPKSYAGSVERLEESLLNHPDYLLFDLDPYIYSGLEKSGDEPELNHIAFRKCCELAKWLKEIFDTLGIEAFIKTTGKTGLHIYVPIIRNLNFDEVRAISGTIGQIILKDHAIDVTMEWAVVRRTGKIFLDHNMNARGKTLASIYSPRVYPQGSVSMPIRWDELDDIYPSDFTMHNVPDLLQQRGDLWADILDRKNDLRKLLTKTMPVNDEPKPRKHRRS